MIKSRKLRLRTIFALLIAFAVIVSSVQIYRVNHTQDLATYQAKQIVYNAGENISLTDENYFFSGKVNLSGYQMKITSTKLISTKDFLKQYKASYQDLEARSMTDTYFDEYDLIYLVDADFQNTNKDRSHAEAIVLDDFLLTWTDNYLAPATDTINTIPDFNPQLKGNSAFAIQSDKTFHVTIPYLIPTTSTEKYTVKEILKDPPKLLIGQYPEEIYAKLPKPDTTDL